MSVIAEIRRGLRVAHAHHDDNGDNVDEPDGLLSDLVKMEYTLDHMLLWAPPPSAGTQAAGM